MVTLIITLTEVMKNMITEIRKTNYYNRKKKNNKNNGDNIANQVTVKQQTMRKS